MEQSPESRARNLQSRLQSPELIRPELRVEGPELTTVSTPGSRLWTLDLRSLASGLRPLDSGLWTVFLHPKLQRSEIPCRHAPTHRGDLVRRSIAEDIVRGEGDL